MKKITFLVLLISFFFTINLNAQTHTELTAGGTSSLNFANTHFELSSTRESFTIDFDADGDEDIIAINSSNNAWHLLRNNGSGVFSVETGTTVGLALENPIKFIVMDFDNDGDQDIIDPTKGTDNQAAIFRNDGGTFVELTAGGTSPLNFANTHFELSPSVRECFAIDYDVDGDEDIIALNSSNNAWHLLRNNGSGVFSVETGTTVGLALENPINFFVMDFDNDGDSDFIDPTKGTDNQAAIFRNNDAPPKISSSTPSDGVTTFDSSANIVITFNENISKGTGNIEIRKVSDNSVIETINVTATTVSGIVLTINPTSNLVTATDLYVHINPGAIIDGDSEIPVSLNNNSKTLNFTAVAANTAPVIAGTSAGQTVNDNSTITPFSAITTADADGADNLTATITLDTNAKGVITGADSGSGPYTITSKTPAAMQTALRALVFNPTDNRTATSETTTFTVVINDGTDSDTDNTTTVISSAVAPTVTSVSSSTVNGTYKVGDNIVITITFSEAVNSSATKLKLETGAIDKTINPDDPDGSGTATINLEYIVSSGELSSDLDYFDTSSLTTFSIKDSGGKDAILTLPSPGAANSLGANKMLVIDGILPTLNSSSPADGATAIATDSNIVLTFDENIAFGTGNIQVIDISDASNSFTIDAASPGAQASISGAVLTINPSSNLDDNSNYAIQIAATAIDDTSGNSFAGITDNTSLDFTTAAAAPTVSTTAASSITKTTATLAGNATANGGVAISERGYVYSITTENSDPLIDGTDVTKLVDGTGTGVFSESISSLTSNTQYSYKAYAINSQGTSYGSTLTFRTIPDMDVKGNAVSITDGDNSPVLTDHTDFGTLSGTLRTYTIHNLGSGNLQLGSGAVSITGTNASEFSIVNQPSTIIASGGSTSFTINFTSTSVSTRSAIINIKNIDVATYVYTFSIQGVGETAAAPTLTTNSAAVTTTVSGFLGGNISSNGGHAITERGIVYSKTSENSNPIIGGANVTKNTNGTGPSAFNETIAALTSNTPYSFKAYAINSQGTSYGAVQTFTTHQLGATHFATLGADDSGGTGFKTNASNANYVISNIMTNDGNGIYVGVNTAGVTQTYTIKADGANAETFSVDVMNVNSFANQTYDQTSTVVFKGKDGSTLQTMTLNADKELTPNATSIFSFFDNGTTTPINNVAQIVVTLVPTTPTQNVENWASTDITISNVVAPDNTNPVDPVITTPATALTLNAATQNVTGTHTENGVTIHAYADNDNDGVADNTTSLGSATVSGNAWSFSVNIAADTANNFVVQAVDGSNNKSNDVDVPTITEDSTNPANPVVTSPVAAITVNAATGTASGTHVENGVTVHAYIDADNNGVADNSTSLGSSIVVGNAWSFSVSLTPDTTNNFVVKAVDNAGNSSNDVDVPTVTEDSTNPADPVVTIPASAITINAATQTISGTHTENGIIVIAYADSNNDGNADNTTALGSATVSGNTWSFSVNLTADTVNNFVVQAVDGANNKSNDVDVPTITEDSTTSTVLEVTSDKTNGTYGVGESINIYVQYDEEVFVTGTPQLTLETGTTDRTINYVDRSVSTLRFVYIVQSGDESADLDVTSSSALALNSGTIKDAADNNASLTVQHGATSGSLSLNKNIVISASVPSVTTTDASSIDQFSATLGGNVTDQGGSTVTERGIIISVTSTNSNPEIGGTGVTKDANATGTGVFSESISGLNPNKQYSFRAYAINSSGTVYGTVKTFTTPALLVPTITFTDINKIYGDENFNLAATSNSGGTISYSIVTGGTGSASLSGTNNETVTLGNVGTVTIKASVAGNGYYDSSSKDITLTINKRAITVTADTNQKKTSGDSDPVLTYQITTGSLVGSDAFTGALTRESGETTGTYAIQIGTLSAGANYNITFVPNNFIIDVVVTTGIVTRSSKSVAVTGQVSSLIGIVERGVVYSTTDTTPEVGEPGVIKVIDDTLTGPFIVEITGLNPSTTYYFQSYIITNVAKASAPSTLYGGIKSFATLPTEPVLVSKNPTNETLKVDPQLTVSLTFDKDMKVQTGNILIKKVSDDSLVESIDVTSGNITIKNNIVQINPTADLPQKTALYVIIPLSSFSDLSDNNWSGLVNKTDWTFTTDDTTDPTVTNISPLDNAIDVAPSDNLTVTFSEDMAKGTGNILVKKTSDDTVIATLDVTSSEISIASNIVTINPTTDLPSETDMYIQVPNTAFKDLYDNAYAGFTDKTIWNFTTADITAPTVTITSTKTNYTNTPFTATFTFSEDIKNFDLSDITIVNAAASIFNKINDAKYTALITPASEGDVTLSVAADKLQDLSNNNNTASNIFSIKYDITKPSLVITSDTTNPTNVSSFVATFTFSEDMDEFDPSYFTVTNATVSNFITVNDAVFKATITPITDGSVTIDVAEDETEDYAGNENTAAQYITVVDTVKPTVTITSSVANPTNIPFTATFTFSEDVAGFEIGDITLGNATASNFTATSSSVYTALITPTVDGNTTIDIAADVANDTATNGNTVATQFSVLYDNTKPAISISSATANPTNNTFTAIFTFSEAVSNFVVGDIDVTNATISNFTTTSSSVYSALITPTVDGNVTIDVAADVANDNATNNNTAATQFSMLYDTTKPTIVISSPVANPTNSTFTATFTFSEAVSNFEITDITLSNATASNFAATSSLVYTALITPITDGTVTIDVAADLANDAAMNNNTAASQFSTTYDATNPTIIISSPVANPTNVGFTATFTFSEAVSNFEIDDITLGNATASNFITTSTTVYTALITPTTDGTVTVDVVADVANDAATNGNTVATQFSTLYDFTNPTVVISSPVSNPTNTTFTTTFTFSEDVTDFVIGDITLGNATASNFTATSSAVYTALITPIADGTVTIDIAADVAADAATNTNIAATQFSTVYDATAPDMPIVIAIDDYTCAGNTTTTADNTLVFNGTAEASSSVEVFINNSSVGTTTTNGSGTWSFDYTSVTLADATYNITATATDAATNTSNMSAVFSIIIDTKDFDEDGNPDFCDTDDDNDGVLDADDNSYLPNPDQLDTDGDGLADVEEDCDNDGIVNYYDTDVASCQNGIVMKEKYGFSPNGDGVNDAWVIENIQLFPNNVVHIYNRSGKLVYTMKGYDNSFNGFSNKINSGKKLPVGAYYFTVEFNTPGAKPAKGWIYINY